jgi:hypothetical protein
MIVVVITMVIASRKEEKILCLVPMIVRQPHVIMMEVVSLKMARTHQIVQVIAPHPLNAITMVYAMLENIGLHVATVHHAPLRNQNMTMLQMPAVF